MKVFRDDGKPTYRCDWGWLIWDVSDPWGERCEREAVSHMYLNRPDTSIIEIPFYALCGQHEPFYYASDRYGHVGEIRVESLVSTLEQPTGVEK